MDKERKCILEGITPHTIGISLLLEAYVSQMKARSGHGRTVMSVAEKRRFMLGLLKLIHKSFQCLSTLLAAIRQCSPGWLVGVFITKLQSTQSLGLDSIMNSVTQFSGTNYFVELNASSSSRKVSIMGAWIRRLLAAYDRLSFSEICLLRDDFIAFCNGANTKEDFVSKGHALSFLQSAVKAFGTMEEDDYGNLSARLSILRARFPDLTEIYFLRFLIARRQLNLTAAVSALHDYFDWAVTPKHGFGTLADASKKAPFALSRLYEDLGYSTHAEMLIYEAIQLNQESFSQEFLLQALYALYRVEGSHSQRSAQLLDHILQEATKCDAHVLKLLCELSCCQTKALRSKEAKSDIAKLLMLLAEIWSETHQGQVTYLQQAIASTLSMIYCKHGHYETAALLALKSLSFANGSSEQRALTEMNEGFATTEALSVAVSHLANAIAEADSHAVALELVQLSRRTIARSGCESGRLLQLRLSEHLLLFDRCYLLGNRTACEKALAAVAGVDGVEWLLRDALLLCASSKSDELIAKIEKYKKANVSSMTDDTNARFLLLLSKSHKQMKTVGFRMDCLSQCCDLSRQLRLRRYHCAAILGLAEVLCDMAPARALQLIETPMMSLHYGNIWSSERLLTKAKVLLAMSKAVQPETTYYKLSLEALMEARGLLIKSDAKVLLKNILHILAHVCHVLQMFDQRNNYAHEFRLLDEECPSNNTAGPNFGFTLL